MAEHVNGGTWLGGHAVKDVYTFEWSDQSPWVRSRYTTVPLYIIHNPYGSSQTLILNEIIEIILWQLEN